MSDEQSEQLGESEGVERTDPLASGSAFQSTVILCLVVMTVFVGFIAVITYQGWSRQQAQMCQTVTKFMGQDVVWSDMSGAQKDYADKLGCDVIGKP